MKITQILLILLYSTGFLAQNPTKLNKDLNLPDSLEYKREIRIYQSGGISNYSSVFRMFNYERKKWTAEFYKHYAAVPEKTNLKVVKRKVKAKNDLELVFLNFLRSKVLNLPNQEEIQWKIQGRDSIFKIKRKWKKKNIIEYESIHSAMSVLDGTSYRVQVRELNKKNDFLYYNPETYLKKYNEVDELIFMSEILNIIRKEFEIWKIN